MEDIMARIFVSYSRKNKDFCKQLTDELQKRELDFWVDWEGIPPTVDWMNEIEKGIEEADTFLAIISMDWITSKVCIDELNIAVKNGKRLIPVVPFEIVWNDVPPSLAQLNFIFFTPNFDFNEQLNKLFTALDTDYDWQKTHRRLQVKALEWERSNVDAGFLLRGRDLEDAEKQLSINAAKNPFPTELQRSYVLKSRQSADRQRKITTAVQWFIILILLGISGVLGIPRILDRVAHSSALGEMIPIPAGPTFYGSEDPEIIDELGFPARQEIPLLPAFQIGKFEVSNYQYGLCVKYGNCTVPQDQTEFQDPDKLHHPVVNVTVYQANNYCQWLGQRLPTMFEWQRAAHGPQGTLWPWGDEDPTPELANMALGDSYEPVGLEPVDSYAEGTSPEGIYNLIGNAWEWTSTFATEEAIHYATTDFWDGEPDSYSGTSDFVEHGGGWYYQADDASIFIPEAGISARNDLGIRCAADID
jgi:formylglycine-generating enzyme required for sulfatase activity